MRGLQVFTASWLLNSNSNNSAQVLLSA